MEERQPNPTYEQLVALVAELRRQNLLLQKRIEQLEAQLRSRPPGPPTLPAFVKPVLPPRKKRRPGRPDGHEAALRAVPGKIDQTVEVPLPAGGDDACRCPRCSGKLIDFKEHERLVEDIVPSRPIVTRYRTSSGFCGHCNKRVESRHPDQPPAANLPHGQLGLNALAVAAVLKHDAGLPYRKVTRLLNATYTRRVCRLEDLPGENNAAERAIRPAVVIRKISGGHRGHSTATASAVITSILRTARQQGRHLLDTLKNLVQSHLVGTSMDLLTSTSE